MPEASSRRVVDSIDPMGPRVLVVEDETSIAEPLASHLTREGFTPEIAGTHRGRSRGDRPRGARRDPARRDAAGRGRPGLLPRRPRPLRRADRDAHRPRRGGRPDRRPRARRRRLRRQAVLGGGARRADPRDPAPRPVSPTPAVADHDRRDHPGPVLARRHQGRRADRARREGVRPPQAPDVARRRGGRPRGDHGRGLGPALVRTHEDPRRPHLVAPEEDRGRALEPGVHHHRPRGRVPLRRSRRDEGPDAARRVVRLRPARGDRRADGAPRASCCAIAPAPSSRR